MVSERLAKPSSRNAFRVRITDAPLRKDMSFLIEVSITSPFAARMILLRMERDRPAVFSSIYPTMLEVKLNPYPLRRNERDRRCRSEARRMEHSLVCERSGVRILPLRWTVNHCVCDRTDEFW